MRKRVGDPETLWHGEQAGFGIELHILARVEHIEAADPHSNRCAKNQHAPIEASGDRDPCGGRRNAQREAEEDVRPVGEALGVRIEKKNGERDGR